MKPVTAEIESKYEILEKMGEGGMGAVYKVRHRYLDDIQVIKLIAAKFRADDELKERFLREAKTAKQLRHPNIAEVIDFNITADGTAYIVMEYIEGIDLRELLSRNGGPLEFHQLIPIAEQALSALGFLHSKRFVHRDVSPDNVMLSTDENGNPRAKLIDLGITKSVESTSNLTMVGKFIGKVHYASPEQFGGTIDSRSDLYSFGVMLYELLTGSKPIGGSDYLSIIAGHTSKPPRPFAESDPRGRVPERVRRVVMKALAKERNERWQTADDFSRALRGCILDDLSSTLVVPLPSLARAKTEALGTVSEQFAWNRAEERNSITSWEEFLETYPDSSHAPKARDHIEHLEEIEDTDWNRANELKSTTGWREYLQRHGDSPRASKARRALDRIERAAAEEQAWSAAVARGSVTGWQGYLRQFGDAARSEEARKNLERIEQAEAEQRAWTSAVDSDSITAWDSYLSAYGDSPRAPQARRNIERVQVKVAEERDWAEAGKQSNVIGWTSYLRAHPDSHRAAEARNNLDRAERAIAEDRAWSEATERDTAKGWAAYLLSFDDASRAADARIHLAAAEAKEREERDWHVAETEGTATAWRTFLKRNPSSRRKTEAEVNLESAAEREAEDSDWRYALATNTLEAWESFLAAHGSSPHSTEAKELLTAAREHEKETARQRAAEAERVREEAARAQALQTGTVASFRHYLERYNQASGAPEIRARLETALEEERQRAARAEEDEQWSMACSIGTAPAYRIFIDQHPHSSRIAQARQAIKQLSARAVEAEREEALRRTLEVEARDWKAALSTGTRASFQAFLDRHPSSARAAEARNAIERIAAAETRQHEEDVRREREAEAQHLQAEETAWVTAASATSTETVEAFLSQFPQSSHRKDARKLIGRLWEAEQQRARDAETMRARVEEENAWNTARASGTSAALEIFLSAHPQSSRSGEARKEIERLHAAEAERQRRTEIQYAPAAQEMFLPEPAEGTTPISVTLAGTVIAPTPPLVEPRTRLAGNQKRTILIGTALTVLVILSLLMVLLVRRAGPGEKTTTDSATTTFAGPTAAEQSTIPTTGNGQLVIDARPWGEITAVLDTSGADRRPTSPLYTPALLLLPPGDYTLELSNPNSGRTEKVHATVKLSELARYQVKLDSIDVEDYIRRIGGK
jgi:serine/threonine protein kinase